MVFFFGRTPRVRIYVALFGRIPGMWLLCGIVWKNTDNDVLCFLSGRNPGMGFYVVLSGRILKMGFLCGFVRKDTGNEV